MHLEKAGETVLAPFGLQAGNVNSNKFFQTEQVDDDHAYLFCNDICNPAISPDTGHSKRAPLVVSHVFIEKQDSCRISL